MAIPALDSASGQLPKGRHCCGIDEIRLAFVDAPWVVSGSVRSSIWSEFEQAAELLGNISDGLVIGLWMGGSFTSTKPEPDDIDVTFLLDAESFDRLSQNKKKRITDFGKHGRLREKTGLRVDAFTLTVRRVAVPWRRQFLTEAEISYFEARGMWDDWWQRCRSNPDKDAVPLPGDAKPVRGYLEVLL